MCGSLVDVEGVAATTGDPSGAKQVLVLRHAQRLAAPLVRGQSASADHGVEGKRRDKERCCPGHLTVSVRRRVVLEHEERVHVQREWGAISEVGFAPPHVKVVPVVRRERAGTELLVEIFRHGALKVVQQRHHLRIGRLVVLIQRLVRFAQLGQRGANVWDRKRRQRGRRRGGRLGIASWRHGHFKRPGHLGLGAVRRMSATQCPIGGPGDSGEVGAHG
mmetsp:Transcript_2151/g.6384  ORF Transcript_2151/g.6384 Transcript_2151/m.6384 type:complete len:219 (+) Transcript_2151:1613-2269(+)